MQGVHAQQKQVGFTFVELSIALVILSILSSVFMKVWVLPELEKGSTRIAGRELAMYSFAAQRRLSQEGVAVLGGAATLTFNGTDWLQNGCPGGVGSAPNAYLDCDFNPLNQWGEGYTATLSEPTPGRVRAEIRIDGPKALRTSGAGTLADVDPSLLYVMRNAAASRQPGMSPVSTMFYDVRVEDNDADGRADTLVTVQSTELAFDIWLRVDGANAMTADLDMGGNNLVNANSGQFADFISVSGGAWGTVAGSGAGAWATSTNALFANDTDVQIVGGDVFDIQATNLLRLQSVDAVVSVSPNTVNSLTSDGAGKTASIIQTNDNLSLSSNDSGVSTTLSFDSTPGLSASVDIQTSNPAAGPTTILDFIQIGGAASGNRGTLISTNDTSIGYIANRGIIEVLDFDNGGSMQDGILAFADNPGGAGVEVSGQGFDLRVTGTGTNEATIVADNVYDPTVNRFLDQAVFDKTVVQYRGTPIKIPKPTCKAGRVPQVFTSVQGAYHISGRPILGFDVDVTDMGVYWNVAGVVWMDTDKGRTRLYDNAMKIEVDRKCS
ncbi:type II secretion system protein [Reinekea sp. G2M2-21]|uniref:type II secretion system protein n=1 Tax=Reinekea sp. G2M2-21 TaxID=2788942 RepID=UPI0018AB687D|nr:type II secretion system protein [Reinekea sp. G2M2-21]